MGTKYYLGSLHQSQSLVSKQKQSVYRVYVWEWGVLQGGTGGTMLKMGKITFYYFFYKHFGETKVMARSTDKDRFPVHMGKAGLLFQ